MNEPIHQNADVGVVLMRRAVDHPWVDHVWSPHQILWPAPQTPDGTVLSDEDGSRLVYLGAATVELFPGETANYKDNLTSGEARLWVAARSDAEGGLPQSVRVTADPTEGEALFEAGSDIVGSLPMPAELIEWISAFVETFHVEREFLKRKRDRKDRPFERGAAGARYREQ
jgi:hypothetical protein